MSDAIELVQHFCTEWGNGSDAATIASYFTDDAVYHNIPIDPVVGRAGIQATVEMFTAGVEGIEFIVHHIVAQGDVVLTERLDIFRYADRTIELPVMGTFEVHDGKITAWRDYFDLATYMNQLNA
jgi:limonene-1,2-epoxide hydrolase